MLSSESVNKPFRSGFAALVGKPNVGKSTLMNALVGHKVSIVSNKAQTTRRRVLGILTEPEYQLVFVDTPGVHKPHTQLGKILNEIASASMTGVDVVCVVVDASKMPDKEDEAIASMLTAADWIDAKTKQAKPNLVLCLNKMDLLKAHNVVQHNEAYTKLFGTENTMLTSLSRGQNLEKLLPMLTQWLPEGPMLYPEDEFTDQPMRIMASEFIREKALRLTKQEVPHAIAVLVDRYEEEDGLVRISAEIIVEKDSQKAIIIGKGGSMLKTIGSEARKEIEDLIDSKVFLEIFVKVRPEWRQNPRMLQELEYLQ